MLYNLGDLCGKLLQLFSFSKSNVVDTFVNSGIIFFMNDTSETDFIKFLGTAGARIVVSKQLRASGGMWYSLDGYNVLVDPGPGCLVRCISSKPKMDPMKLDAIILTHRHLDHAADVNVMIEAMTEGGFKNAVYFLHLKML